MKYSTKKTENFHLIFLIPMTIIVIMNLFYYIRWDYFGITEGINPFYTNKFKSALDSYVWVASEMGVIGIGLFTILLISYLLMWRKVYVLIFIAPN